MEVVKSKPQFREHSLDLYILYLTFFHDFGCENYTKKKFKLIKSPYVLVLDVLQYFEYNMEFVIVMLEVFLMLFQKKYNKR